MTGEIIQVRRLQVDLLHPHGAMIDLSQRPLSVRAEMLDLHVVSC